MRDFREEADDARNYWLEDDPKEEQMTVAAEESGVTKDQYLLFSRLMRRPVYEWLEFRWYSTTEQYAKEHRISENAEENREKALRSLRDFLSQFPQIPISGLRELISQVVGEYYLYHGMASRMGRFKVKIEDVNLFIDEALAFFQARAQQHASSNLADETNDTRNALEGLTETDSIEDVSD